MSKILGTPVSRITGITQSQHGTTQLTYSIPALLNTSTECLSYPVPTTIPNIPNFGFVSARAKQANDGTWNWELTYEGPGVLGNPNDPNGENLAVYALEPSDQQIPLASHPDIIWIMDHFGGKIKDGVLSFSEKIPPTAGSSSQSQSKLNPFFAVEDYLSFGATWSKTYAVKGQFPADAMNAVETVVQSVPTPPWMTFPNLGAARNWLKKVPSIGIRGTAVTITERYLLSGRGGINPYMYRGLGQ